MKLPIYLDYASTTPIDQRIIKKMVEHMTINGVFGNSSSNHWHGWKASESVDIARNQVSELINSDPFEVIFTSSATESNNLAIKGIAFAKNKIGNHIITSAIEHKSVLNTCKYLETLGFKVTYLYPNKDGTIDQKQLVNELNKNTILVSLMYVNNEIGIINDIYSLGNICKNNNIIFHVDATQIVGKLPINMNNLPIDLMSFSGHKLYGPKGIGILYIKRKYKDIIKTQIHGGGQEYNIRSGTLPVHQIVGIGEACNIAKKEMDKEILKINFLKKYLWNELKNIDNITINGCINKSIATILNISLNNVKLKNEILSNKYLALSDGSSCNSNKLKHSHVLKAMKLSKLKIKSSLRFSIGKFTSLKDIKFAINIIKNTIINFNKKN